MTRLHFLTCYRNALRSGFTGYAAGILATYRWIYGAELLPPPRFVQWVGRAHRLPDDRAERDGRSTGISK